MQINVEFFRASWHRVRARVARVLVTALVLYAGWELFQLVIGYRLVPIDPFQIKDEAQAASVQAAWFQAAGSVIAIVAAIWISQRQVESTRILQIEELQRRASIAGTSMIFALQGVAIDARTKGIYATKLAEEVPDSAIHEAWVAASTRFRLHSVDLAVGLMHDVGSFSSRTGMELAAALQLLNPVNATLADVLVRHGSKPSAKQLRDMFMTIAYRCGTAQLIAANGIVALAEHPAFKSAMTVKDTRDFSWCTFENTFENDLQPLP